MFGHGVAVAGVGKFHGIPGDRADSQVDPHWFAPNATAVTAAKIFIAVPTRLLLSVF